MSLFCSEPIRAVYHYGNGLLMVARTTTAVVVLAGMAIMLSGCDNPKPSAKPAPVPVGSTDQKSEATSAQTELLPGAVKMERQGNIYVVPVRINDQLTLNFTVDSGASDVSIPADVVMVLMRTNTIDDSDYIGTQTYTLADGSTTPSSTFRIRELRIGNFILKNVTASIADPRAPLLLGESFLSRFRSWKIDNKNKLLVLQPLDVDEQAADNNAPALAPAADTASTNVPNEPSTTAELSPTPTPDAQPSTEQASAIQRVRDYWAAVSSPDSNSIEVLVAFYGDPVEFYGASVPRAEVMRQKAIFRERWPSERYVPRDNTMIAACEQQLCTVTGIVDWDDQSDARGSRSRGVANFTLKIAEANGRNEIVGETSAVICRQMLHTP